jgi:hypothetical protein
MMNNMTEHLSECRTHSNISDSSIIDASTDMENISSHDLHTSSLNEVPKIFFGSRTHKQLAQIIKELKTTSYKPTMTLLGSRDQYCIHKNVSKAKNKTEEW